MGLPVIITRSAPGADETAARLETAGYSPILSPVIGVAANPDVALPELAGVAGIVFTSANGVRLFEARSAARDLPVWCVGPATAAAARMAGFARVEESAGDARDLAAYIAARWRGGGLPLLHIANAAAKGDLKAGLQARGIDVVFCALYRMERAPALTTRAVEVLSGNGPGMVLVHSEKGAEAFAGLASGYDLSGMVGATISKRAAGPLLDAGFGGLFIADAPNEDGLFVALSDAAATLST